VVRDRDGDRASPALRATERVLPPGMGHREGGTICRGVRRSVFPRDKQERAATCPHEGTITVEQGHGGQCPGIPDHERKGTGTDRSGNSPFHYPPIGLAHKQEVRQIRTCGESGRRKETVMGIEEEYGCSGGDGGEQQVQE